MTDTNIAHSPWFTDVSTLLSSLHATKDGLTNKEAEARKNTYGPNTLTFQSRRTPFAILASQFENWLMIVLIAAAIVSFVLGGRVDGLVILAIVCMSVTLGFFQEYKAEKTLEKLKRFITHTAKVKRDGIWQEVDSNELVVGDIVELRIGDRVPADIRLIETDDVSINESIVTGESEPVVKKQGIIAASKTLPQDQTNMAFSSTYVASGVAIGVVTATAGDTVVGKTSSLLQQEAPQTDFQKQMKQFSSLLFKIIMIMVVFVFLANALLGKGTFDSLLFAVALAVGVTPELLPMIITVTLSQGALQMAKKKVVVKRLISVEDFGNMDTLCTDKTGTLTEGKFTFKQAVNLNDHEDETTLLYGLICSSGFGSNGKNASSNQVDAALWESAQKEKPATQLPHYTLVDENEFDFERKRMSVVVSHGNKLLFIAKGAPEQMVPVSTHYYDDKQKVQLLNDKIRQKLHEFVAEKEEQGFRVIAVSHKLVHHKETTLREEQQLTLRGFLLFEDPPKESAKHSLSLFKNLGVAIKVVSGDSPRIVKKIAIETGLSTNAEQVITGEELQPLSREAFADTVRQHRLFARITPEQKYMIVLSLNQEGHIVGFLGDGINDAPALRAADVGVAVDSGTDVAKEAADIVLMKKDLAVLATGIERGRKIFGNVTKYILNTVSANYGNMFTVAISSLFLPFIPLLSTQILLNNFISDIPLLALATDRVDPGYTKRPRKWNIGFITHFMLSFGLLSSLFDFATILPLIYIWNVHPDTFRTAWFVESSLSEMLITFAIRTRLPLYKSKPSNWLVILSVLAGLAVLLLPAFPLTRELFSFVALPSGIVLWIIGVLVTYMITTELVKKVFYKKFDDIPHDTIETRV
ncbi:magnesium-translocating P-type ATPase [Candidatus Roizmanbacteria bacterium]|nr:magnesium-translocating P-type ATPase [Candidatus Roizmanbacteria bacterium]